MKPVAPNPLPGDAPRSCSRSADGQTEVGTVGMDMGFLHLLPGWVLLSPSGGGAPSLEVPKAVHGAMGSPSWWDPQPTAGVGAVGA